MPKLLRALSILTILGASALPLPAQVVNGSFESGLTGWTLGPDAGVEALQFDDFGTNTIPVPDGAWFALVTNGPDDRPAAPGGDFDGNGIADSDSSTLSTTFTTVNPGETLGFSWAFLTNEVGPGSQGSAQYDDVFDITIDGISIVRGSVNKPQGSSPWADTVAYDSMRYTVQSAGTTDGADFGDAVGGGRTPFENFCVTIADPGTYTLQFLVADQADSAFDSGLLVDNVTVNSGCDATLQITNSSESAIEVKGGGFEVTLVTNGRVVSDGDGSTLAFVSNGNYTGNNPNLRSQIWTADRNGPLFTISQITSAVSATHGTPYVSVNGQWLTFASTIDPTSGNADGNSEIFRFDLDLGTLLQITSTAGCSNSEPTIRDDGAAIAFVSDCDLGIGTTGEEIFLWEALPTPTFRGIDTVGCTSWAPRIAGSSGRFVTFVTDCDGQYPGTTNPDGGPEIVQWDSQPPDVYLQLTTTGAGLTNDVAASNADGRFVSFISDADHQVGENPGGSLVVFRYDRNTGSFLQMVDPNPLKLFTYSDIDASGAFVAAERIDPVTPAFDIVLLDVASPRSEFPVVLGGAGVSAMFPSIAVSTNLPRVLFQSNGDFSGNNADGNIELWASLGVFDKPDTSIFCSTPGVAIPDNNNPGIQEFINVTASGTLVDLDLFVHIEHTFVGDLRIVLQHIDSGSNRSMLDRAGRPPGPGCSGDDVQVTFDDEAASPAEDECVTPGPIAIGGTLTPRRSLARFDGEDILGSWRLTVSDRRRSNSGTLVEWCLVASTQ